MVDPAKARENAITALRNWVQGLPDAVARIEETEAPHEYVVRVIPRNPRSAVVTFRISEYGTFGLYIGTAIRIEELPLTSEYILEICEAVRKGKFVEETWSRGGALLKASGVLQLTSGDLQGTEYRGAFGSLGSDEHTKTAFEPYS